MDKMNILQRIKFVLTGQLDDLLKKADKEGYDRCFNGAMKWMVEDKL